MPVERDDGIRDELLQRVVTELRRPVRLDPSVDARALREIRRLGAAGRPRPAQRPLWLAGAALAASLLLAVLLRSSGDIPVSRVASTIVAPDASTRPVRLRLASPASSRVAVVGDFNDWDPGATPLRPTEEQGVWTVELQLRPGRYHYTFLIDGRRWERDPSEPRANASDFGAPMSVLTVS